MKVIPFVPNGSNVISSQPIKIISTSNSPISSKPGIPAQPKYHTVVAQPTGPIKKNGTASGEVRLQKVEKIEHIENNEENTKNNYVSIAGGQSVVDTSPVGTGQPVGSAAPLQLYDKNSLINTEVPREALLKLTLERNDSPDAFHPYFSSPEKVIEYIQRIGNPCEYPYVTIPGKATVPRTVRRTVPDDGRLVRGSARKILLDIQKCIDACRRNKIFYGDELVQVKTFNHVSGMKRYGSMESNPHECKICTALNCHRSVHKILRRVNLPQHH